MKSKLYYTLLCAFTLLTFSAATQEIAANWQKKAGDYARDMEYAFYARPDGAFTISNKENRMQAIISSQGYTIWPAIIEEKQPLASFHLKSIGRKRRASAFTYSSVDNTPSGLVYRSSFVDIEYINTEKGLRQNFIVKEKPKGKGLLRIAMTVFTTLKPQLINEEKLVFHDPANKKVSLSYEGLYVWDAGNKILDAKMEFDAVTGLLSLVVDDHNAVYPVTIDPLNKTPEWVTSAEGILPGLLTNLQLQANTLYGYNVTRLGDINNDGYDDVAVSAPGMANVIAGAGNLANVGAVFIYMGSSSGLSAIPDKILQPTTAVAGALFGLSIDAGDITGDGIPDIVISAPLDRYQTTAGGLLGDVNVNVTAGKVYVYRSEDLSSAANPSPFLQLRLQGHNFFSTGVLGLLNNISVNALFGYSLSVTDDLNGDNKKDIIIGSPAYLGINALSAQAGAAFIYYSNNLSTTSPTQLDVPTPSVLGLVTLPVINLNGLLFGFSVDGAGDYNNDGYPDIVAGAPAGIDLSTLGGIFSGQVLGGSAYIYYGNGNSINPAIGATLQASSSGLLGNAANLFGYKVKGVRNSAGNRNGNLLISAPSSSILSNITNGLRLKAGEVNVFLKKTAPFSGVVVPNQILSSPRSSSLLSVLSGQSLTLSLLYGAAMDNINDINCDGQADIIIGEPLSTNVPMIGANVTGGSAYIYKGNADGTYIATPAWAVYPEVSPLIGINATSLFGFSVAGVDFVKGTSEKPRVLVGGPSNSLDFGTGLLNLGNTVGTLYNFGFDNNGLGKANLFYPGLCSPAPSYTTLPTDLILFTGKPVEKSVQLDWQSVNEINFAHYELQRSTNGTDFKTITVVLPKNSQLNEYIFIDKYPQEGNNYYRLKMVDTDAKFTYSHIVIVRFQQQISNSMIATPNPVRNEFKVQLTGIKKGTYYLKLFTGFGQLLRSIPVSVIQYQQTVIMPPVTSLSKGTHHLILYDNTGKKISELKLLLFMD